MIWGRIAGSGRSVVGFGREVFDKTMEHNVLMWSAGLAYQELFSLFPFLIFLRALVPYIPGIQELIEQGRVFVEEALGPESELYRILQQYVFSELSAETSGALLSLSVIVALYSASAALATMIRAVNLAHGYPETRSWIRRRVTGVLLTLWLAVLLPLSLLVLVLGPWFTDLLAAHLPGDSVYQALWDLARWPLGLLMPLVALIVLYHFAPVCRSRWRWSIPGSLVGVVGVVGVSLGFSWYLSSGVFDPGMLTYGVIGTAMALLFWMYLVSASILVGAEVNAAIRRRSRAAGDGCTSAEGDG